MYDKTLFLATATVIAIAFFISTFVMHIADVDSMLFDTAFGVTLMMCIASVIFVAMTAARGELSVVATTMAIALIALTLAMIEDQFYGIFAITAIIVMLFDRQRRP